MISESIELISVGGVNMSIETIINRQNAIRQILLICLNNKFMQKQSKRLKIQNIMYLRYNGYMHPSSHYSLHVAHLLI